MLEYIQVQTTIPALFKHAICFKCKIKISIIQSTSQISKCTYIQISLFVDISVKHSVTLTFVSTNFARKQLTCMFSVVIVCLY